MIARNRVLLGITALILAALGCAQAGEILTPAEATERVRLTAEADVISGGEGEGVFEVGEEVEITGSEFLIPLRDIPEPGPAVAHVPRGEFGTVLNFREVAGEMWYLVDSISGEGWLQVEYLKSLEVDAGPQVGDTVFLTGRGYMINIYRAPGEVFMVAQQERGVEVVILQIGDFEGKTWVQIEAPTGTGWVELENVSVTPP